MLSTDKSKDNFFFGTDHDNIDMNEYLQKINDITKYYDSQSTRYKKNFFTCCTIRLIASAAIPVISLGAPINIFTIITSTLACVITISEAYVNISRCYDKWTKYRFTCNALWIEQRSFSAHRQKYSDSSTRNKLFIESCESIIENEVSEWREYIKRAQEMQ